MLPRPLLLLLSVAAVRGFPTSQDPRTAQPQLQRPADCDACKVTLFEGVNLTSYGQVAQARYTGLPSCAGRLEDVTMVVLDWTGAVAGVQFDRYGALWLGGVELLRTTTPEPDGTATGVRWHIEKDLTEYRSLFALEGVNASLSIPNTVTSTYTGIEQITATLSFCKAQRLHRAPAPADVVHILDDPTAGVPTGVSPWTALGVSGNQSKVVNVQMPVPNANRAVIDVFASGHQCEEFWYTNVPDPNPNSGQCGGGSYREIQLFIDGLLAGTTLPFPVVYTGGINPLLWRPLTGISSFDIPAYRFDVTPFLGLLNNGKMHNITVKVINNNKAGVWYLDPVLLLWTDRNHAKLTGHIVFHRADPVSVTTHSKNVTSHEVQYSTSARPHGLYVEGTLVAPDGTVAQVCSLKTSVESSNRNTLIGEDTQITVATMQSQTEVRTKWLDSHRVLQALSVRHSESSSPISVHLESKQDNSTFEIDATVQIESSRREMGHVFKHSASLHMPLHGEYDVAWTNRINSSAVYNRSLTNHTLINVMDGSSNEQFEISSQEAVCFNHSLTASNGNVTSDNGMGSYECKFSFCGSEICGALTRNDVTRALALQSNVSIPSDNVKCDVFIANTELQMATTTATTPRALRL